MEYYKLWHAKKVNLFAVEQGPGRVATLVLRWDRRKVDDAVICVVMALGGAGKNIVAGVLPEIERVARMVKAKEVFFDTKRMGLMVALAKAGGGRKFRVSWSI